MPKNNESFGIAAEVAIARSFGVSVNPEYEQRAEEEIVELLTKGDAIRHIFEKEQLPAPVKHSAEKQNPVDFELQGGKTLSVKTNQGDLGLVAPQIVGQTTQKTFYRYLEENKILPNFEVVPFLQKLGYEDNYENRTLLYKLINTEYIDIMLDMYWDKLFECDYLIQFYNLKDQLNPEENYVVLGKEKCKPWVKDEITFTKEAEDWNNSTSLKYYGISLGVFQAHTTRDLLQFRFDMKGVIKLKEMGLL